MGFSSVARRVAVAFVAVFSVHVANGAEPVARIDAPVLKEWSALAASDRYGAFLHVRAGADNAFEQALESLGLTIQADFRRYVPSVFVNGAVAAFQQIAQHPSVERIEYNAPLKYMADTGVWATRARVAQEPVSGGPFYADAEKTQLIDGSGVTLGVIDSGVQGSHPDFENLIHNYKLVVPIVPSATLQGMSHIDVGPLNSENPGGGHGTHCTGIVGGTGAASGGGSTNASSPNISGTYTGVAPGADLMHWGHGATLVVLDTAQAYHHILYHLDAGTEGFENLVAVNNSYGQDPGPYDPSATASQLIDQIVARGIVMAFAASNDGGDGSEAMTSPTCRSPTPGVICVANYNDLGTGERNGPLDNSSSRGLQADESTVTFPDIAAPGANITATCLQGDPTQAICSTGAETKWQPFYGTISGTSMATPHVVGVIGLLQQAYKAKHGHFLSPAEVEELLQRTALPAGPLDEYVEDPQAYSAHPEWGSNTKTHFGYGAGLVDVPSILKAIGTPQRGDASYGAHVVFDEDQDLGDSSDVLTLVAESKNDYEGVSGIEFRFTLASADSFIADTVYTLEGNVAGKAFTTTVVTDAQGNFTASAGGNNVSPKSVERNDTVVSVFVPMAHFGSPELGEPIHNVRMVVTNSGVPLDYAPSAGIGEPAVLQTNSPVFGRAVTVELEGNEVPEASLCSAPGRKILSDGSGDPTILAGLTPALPIDQQDLVSMYLSHPYAESGPQMLEFRLKVSSVELLIPGSAYYISFVLPDASYAGVRMHVVDPTAPDFYWYVPSANSAGGVDGRFVSTQTPITGEVDTSKGEIVFYVEPSVFGIDPTDPDLSTISAFNAGVTQSTDPAGVGLPGATFVTDEMPNGLGRTGSVEILPNEQCALTPTPTPSVTPTPPPQGVDSDGDGVEDDSDNCPAHANADQADTDNGGSGDGVGDVCDLEISLSADPLESDVDDGPVTFTVNVSNSGGGDLRYFYYFGDGENDLDNSSNTTDHDYPEAGNYTVQVVVVEDEDNSESATVQIKRTTSVTVDDPQNPTPVDAKLSLSANGGDFRAPATITLDASGTSAPDGSSFCFDFGDGSMSADCTQKTVTHQYTDPGQYVAIVEVTSSLDESVKDTAQAVITVTEGEATTAQLVVTPREVEVNELVSFDASSSTATAGESIVSYEFDFGDGHTESTTEATATHRYDTAGEYTPSLTVVDSANGTSTTKVLVFVEVPASNQNPNTPTTTAPTPVPVVTAQSARSGSGSLGLWMLAVLPLLALRRRSRVAVGVVAAMFAAHAQAECVSDEVVTYEWTATVDPQGESVENWALDDSCSYSSVTVRVEWDLQLNDLDLVVLSPLGEEQSSANFQFEGAYEEVTFGQSAGGVYKITTTGYANLSTDIRGTATAVIAGDAGGGDGGDSGTGGGGDTPQLGDSDDARVVVAVIDSAINPYHSFYYEGGQTEVTQEVLDGFGVKPENIVELTRTGDIAADIESDREFWDRVEKNEPYFFVGTNIIAVSMSGSGIDPLIPTTDKSEHGVGTSSAVLVANPEAIILFVETEGDLGSDASHDLAFGHPLVDIVSTSYGVSIPYTGFPLPEAVAWHMTYEGVVENGKLHFSSGGNGPGSTPHRAGAGPWWSIGVSGIEEGSSEGDTLLSGNFPDFVSDYTQDLARCMDCETGLASYSGTSFSTPRAAGVASDVILRARQMVGQKGGIRDASGHPLMVEGKGFALDNWFVRRALEQAARIPSSEDYDPVSGFFELFGLPINPLAPWLQIGWGDLSADPEYGVVDAALAHLGLKATGARDKDIEYCDFQTQVIQHRQMYWNTLEGVDTSSDPFIYCENSFGSPASNDPGGPGVDSDSDGTVDSLDECPNDPSNSCSGTGGDPQTDSDGDGVPDESDNCPTISNADQADTDNGGDGDGVGDACDLVISLTADPQESDVDSGAVTLTANVTNSGGGTLRYFFYFGDGGASGEQELNDVSHDYPNAGNYTAHVVVVENESNTETASVTLKRTTSVTVDDPVTPGMVTAQLSMSANGGDFRAPATITFDASGSTAPDGSSYCFSFGDGSMSDGCSASIVMHTYDSPGTYTAEVEVISADDSSVTDIAQAVVTIVAAEETTAQLVVSPRVVDVGETVHFDATSSRAAEGAQITGYVFDFGDGSPTVTDDDGVYDYAYSEAGTWEPSVTVTDDQSGSATTKAEVLVVMAEEETPEPTATPVVPETPTVQAPRTRSGSGAFGLPFIGILLLFAFRRRAI